MYPGPESNQFTHMAAMVQLGKMYCENDFVQRKKSFAQMSIRSAKKVLRKCQFAAQKKFCAIMLCRAQVVYVWIIWKCPGIIQDKRAC